jgi:DNA-binding winged helix-turn-helix (wHTH) protein/tetratricopeptide (TPR) repeat protein
VSSASHRFFPPFRLDSLNAQLWRGDQQIALRPKTFDVLLYLVDHAGQLVTKAALLDAVWANVTVGDSMPAICVAELRKALGDEARIPRFIETVHGRGYRFIAGVSNAAPEEATRHGPAIAKSTRPMMVGREEELAQLQHWYAQVLEGQRRVIFVTGETGIGKTTFVQAFLDFVAKEGTARVGRGQCIEQYGAGEPYMPVLEALSRMGQGPGGAGIVGLLRRFAPMWLAQMPSLIDATEVERLHKAAQGVTQQRMLREMVQALEALAGEAPLVLLLEDLHWSDFSTLELISAVARRNEQAQLLVIGSYRPVEMLAHKHPLRIMKQELEIHSYCQELRLKLLNQDDVAGYLAKRFSSDDAWTFEGLAPVIYERTDGNPLFMVNVVDYLVDAGLLVRSREASATELAKTLRADGIEVPRSVRQMIERNLEGLKPEEQTVLESASVVGAEFSTAAVAAALERPQNEIEAYCVRLARREQFVAGRGAIEWPDGTVAARFRFHHALYQEVLYGLLPPGQRVQLHRLIAVREEAGYGERVNEVATELAHHYSCANDRNKAIHYFRLAGERAVARGAVVEAEGHYRRALKLLGELPQATERDRRELTLQMALGTVLWTAKSWSHPETGRVFARAQELTDALGDHSQFMAVLFGFFISATGSGRYGSATNVAERMLDVGEKSKDPASLSIAHTFLGETLLYRAKYQDAQKHLELASSISANELQGFSEWAFAAPALLAITVLILGYPERARELAAKAFHHAIGCADPNKVAGFHMWLGLFNGMLRDASLELNARVMREMASKHPVWNGFADFFTAIVKIRKGNWQEAGKCLENAVTFHESVGLIGWLNWFNLVRAELFARKGSLDDALELTSNVAIHPELVLLKVPALQLQAELMAQSCTDKSAIESAYRAAINCAQGQGAKYYELQAITSFAKWLKFENREIEARTMLAEIHSWFTEGFDTADLKDAKALLDELGV